MSVRCDTSTNPPCKSVGDQRYTCDLSGQCQPCGTETALCCTEDTKKCDDAPQGEEYHLECKGTYPKSYCVKCGGTELDCCEDTSEHDPCIKRVAGAPRECGVDGKCHICGAESSPCCPEPNECPGSSPEKPLTCIGKDENENNDGTCTACGGGDEDKKHCCSTFGDDGKRSYFCHVENNVCMDAAKANGDPNPDNYCAPCGGKDEPCCLVTLAPGASDPNPWLNVPGPKQCTSGLICLNADGSYGKEQITPCKKLNEDAGSSDFCCFGLKKEQQCWSTHGVPLCHDVCVDAGVLNPDNPITNQVKDKCTLCGAEGATCCAQYLNTGQRDDYCAGKGSECIDGSKPDMPDAWSVRNPDSKCISSQACGSEGAICCKDDKCDMSDDGIHYLNCQSDGHCHKCGEYGKQCCQADGHYNLNNTCQTLHEGTGGTVETALVCGSGPAFNEDICCKGLDVDGKRIDTRVDTGCCRPSGYSCKEDQDCCGKKCETNQLYGNSCQ